jgi:alpha-L-fucosidase 2
MTGVEDSHRIMPARIVRFLRLGLAGVLLSGICASEAETMKVNELDNYNVDWNSPSDDYNGSMPIGNGDLAANVWVEPNGDLVFLVSKSDAWSARHDLLKLGRVRVRMNPPLVSESSSFKQELDLKTGSIRVDATSANQQRSIRFWIDAHHPVINVEIDSSDPASAEVTLESWRAEGKYLMWDAERDVILPSDGRTIRWYQRNTKSIFNESMQNQHLGHMVDRVPDPLMDRTFGGMIAGEGLIAKDVKTLTTAQPMKRIHLRVHVLTDQTETAEAWLEKIERQRDVLESLSTDETWQAHVRWWKAFWDRSYIRLSGTKEAEEVARAYQLQRWVMAGAGRGAYPIKFNGSLFAVDGVADYDKNPEGVYQGPDFMRWGGPYWFQNTRHTYWPMLPMGDYEMMLPLFNMYRDMLPLAQERSRHYFKHEGVYFPETILLWGLHRDWDFTTGKENPGFYPLNGYVRYHWDGGVELSLMMLEYYRHTEDASFLHETLLPVADAVVNFYFQHYPRDENGKVHFSPSQVLETYHQAENPLPVIVGLHAVLTRLLELPKPLTTVEQRTRWTRLLGELPDVPMEEKDGKKWFKPADVYSQQANAENGELYGVFPVNVHGLGRPDLDIVKETYQRRLFKSTGCWRYDMILAARLGETEDAKNYLLDNVTNQFHTVNAAEFANAKRSRFPAFWRTGDWVPDQDHAGVIVNGLQSMLMMTYDDTIHLLPAWPKEWNVDFKLHAPQQTTIEGRVVNGEVVDLKVTPESRRNDVVILK